MMCMTPAKCFLLLRLDQCLVDELAGKVTLAAWTRAVSVLDQAQEDHIVGRIHPPPDTGRAVPAQRAWSLESASGARVDRSLHIEPEAHRVAEHPLQRQREPGRQWLRET